MLRDDTSGICFRDTHGRSTGSQVSWLPLAGALWRLTFTAASDPLVTCYKRFAFARRDDAPSPAIQPDPHDPHGSPHPNPPFEEVLPTVEPAAVEAVARIDLRGGLARVTNSDAVATRMREPCRSSRRRPLPRPLPPQSMAPPLAPVMQMAPIHSPPRLRPSSPCLNHSKAKQMGAETRDHGPDRVDCMSAKSCPDTSAAARRTMLALCYIACDCYSNATMVLYGVAHF